LHRLSQRVGQLVQRFPVFLVLARITFPVRVAEAKRIHAHPSFSCVGVGRDVSLLTFALAGHIEVVGE
jgi:hypothetical protein